MLHLDLPTASEILSLSEVRDATCVSIIIPTCNIGLEVGGSRIDFKNLVKKAGRELEDAGVDKREIADVIMLLDEISADDEFWRFQANSLAVYARRGSIVSFRLAGEAKPLVEVSDRFFLKPLLHAVAFPESGYLLALAVGGPRLYEILPGSALAEVPVPDLPRDAADAVRVASLAVSTQSRRSDGSAAQRDRLARYCRMVDRALREVLGGRTQPLFLAADVTLGAIYRSVNSYPYLSALASSSSPDDQTHKELAVTASELIAGHRDAELVSIRSLFDARAAHGRSTSDVAQAARAATLGAVELFLFDRLSHLPGTIDEETGRVDFSEDAEKRSYGIVDEIARRTLRYGGRVVAAGPDDLPNDAPLAAILRYPV